MAIRTAIAALPHMIRCTTDHIFEIDFPVESPLIGFHDLLKDFQEGQLTGSIGTLRGTLETIFDFQTAALDESQESAERLREGVDLSHARQGTENSLRRKRLTGCHKWLQLSLELIKQMSLDVFVAER